MLEDGNKGVIIQRNKQTYAIAPHIPCGLTSPDVLRKIATVAEKYNAILKITGAQRIAIIGLKEEDIDAVWDELGMQQGKAIGLCVRSIKACPGTDYCKMGMQNSLKLGLELDQKYHGIELPGKLKIGVSGCTHQCAESAIKDIGLVGNRKGWRILVGGKVGGKPRLANELISGLNDDEALAIIEKIIFYYKSHAKLHQRLGALLDTMNFEDFKTKIL